MTPAESRNRLAALREQARAAGLVGVLGQVDVMLGLASLKSIDLLEAALGTTALAAWQDNPTPVQAPGITPPRMPSMMVRKPVPMATAGIIVDVGRHGSPQPPQIRSGVLAGIKKPEIGRPAQEPDRLPMKVPRQPPKPTGWLPCDDEVPF